MEDETIKNIVNNPDKAIESLKDAENAIKSLVDANNTAKTEMNNQNESEGIEESDSDEGFKEIIDNLLERLSGGYRYYDISSDQKNRSEMVPSERYYITDLEGDRIADNLSDEGVIDYVKDLIKHDGEESSEHKTISTIDDAKSEMELHKLGKVINVKDTKQLDLFPKKDDKTEDSEYSKVISKMSDTEVKNIIIGMGSNGWILKKAISAIESGDDKKAYIVLRHLLDMRKGVNEENLDGKEILSNIVESNEIRLTKSDILTFIKERK